MPRSDATPPPIPVELVQVDESLRHGQNPHWPPNMLRRIESLEAELRTIKEVVGTAEDAHVMRSDWRAMRKVVATLALAILGLVVKEGWAFVRERRIPDAPPPIQPGQVTFIDRKDRPDGGQVDVPLPRTR